MRFLSKFKYKLGPSKTRCGDPTGSAWQWAPPTLAFARSPSTDTAPTVPTVSHPDAVETTPTGTTRAHRRYPLRTMLYGEPSPQTPASGLKHTRSSSIENDTDYQTYLATASGADAVPPIGHLSPDLAKFMVEQLQEKREEKQCHVIFHGKDIKFRAQAEKLGKVFVWCNGVHGEGSLECAAVRGPGVVRRRDPSAGT
ncbi:hypothetical protein PGQ11_011241 [Apiospora arundinis]|uniref:Uncharacterized protein n=1 Tax=Apiospora arundinis TaxID=335852 RepID=A0ABR2HZ36_9PEZI